MTRVSTHPPGPPGPAGPDTLPFAAPDLAVGNGPVEWVMSRVIRKLAWSRLSDPMVALTLSGAGLLLGMIVGATAPNAETIPLQLPLSHILPSLGHSETNVVIASILLYTGNILACLGLAGMLWAHSQGWRPNPKHLLWASAAIIAVMVSLTPVGSSDTGSYAAYGRIAALGGNPYTTGPLAFLGPHSSYTQAVGTLWKTQPSVYGPFATVIQSFAASIGGPNVSMTVWALMILNGAVFIGVGFLLLKTSADPVRATLFWTANPVLIQQLVSGGHLDTLVAAAAICAIQVARRVSGMWGDVLIGVLIGLACGIKINAVLIALGLAWPLLRRHEWMRTTRIALVALVTVALQYWPYGLVALKPIFGGLKLATLPSPWRVLELIGAGLGRRGGGAHGGHGHGIPLAGRHDHRRLVRLPADLLGPAGRGGGAVRADLCLDPRRPVGVRLVHRHRLGRADPGAAQPDDPLADARHGLPCPVPFQRRPGDAGIR